MFSIRQRLKSQSYLLAVGLFVILTLCLFSIAKASDPLPSWNNGVVKTKILQFVSDITNKASKDYVLPEQRIAVFDNDGTLWVEQPISTQHVFIFDQIKKLVPNHPEWKTTQPFKALLEGDMETVGKFGTKGFLKMIIGTHSGMTATEFANEVSQWISKAKHPRFNRLYTKLVYQPQLELLAYLRANGFKTYIISGSGMEFMRPWTEKIYGIPPEQVVGSSVAVEFKMIDGKPAIIRLPKVNFINNNAGKPVGIYQHIGRRPILAFGNSDADIQMVQYTKAGNGKSLGLFLHHNDAKREYAYDRKGHIGTLDKALDIASENDWIIVDMKHDWKHILPN
ncbi:HAD family hydrolase [Halodesulfovibrio marinisediminis]|uniref:Phosphoserine phosphatase n=1 Tax=Halodesulfovibrio marinisediminis DSM 17456 TaxID=1121457 RepID=A0A1N6GPW6_9BACT|nr:HAD family hydrolase [Halodesulfovibrio marinisediminis]SIO09515.1 Phosphoserine phosphatase [Halodesulfovibrio marinisediminis DSM 17456]